MTEKFHFVDNRHTIVGWAFIMTVSQLSKDVQNQISVDEDGCYDVDLTINGVPCSFSHILTRLNATVDAEIKQRAKEMITEKLDTSFDALEELTRDISTKIRKLFELPDHED